MDESYSTLAASSTEQVSDGRAQGTNRIEPIRVHNPYTQNGSPELRSSRRNCVSAPDTNPRDNCDQQHLDQTRNQESIDTETNATINTTNVSSRSRTAASTSVDAMIAKFNLNNSRNKGQKSSLKKSNNAEARAYLDIVAATLPTTLGSFCKNVAEELLKLTDQIDSQQSVSLELDSKGPATLLRSLRLKIDLNSSTVQKETYEYKTLAEDLSNTGELFQKRCTSVFKTNNENMANLIEGERLT